MTKSTTKRVRKYAQDFSGETQTQQQFKDSVDVNNIVRSYTRTGIDPYADRVQNQKFGFATSKDFTESAYAVAEINSAFADLPSAERSQHDNEPANWLESLIEPEPSPEPETAPEALSEPPAEPASTPDKPET